MFSRSRITLVVWIAAVATALAVQTATVHAQPADTPWPMWGQNAQRTSVGLQGPSENDLMWVAGYQTGEEVAIGKKAIYIAGGGVGLQAMNFDGTLRWTCPIGSTDQCCPAISQDEDGHGLAPAAGAVQDIHAGQAGQAEIEDDEIEAFALQGQVGGMTVAQPVDGEASLAQAYAQAIAQFGVVFDEQDTHGGILRHAGIERHGAPDTGMAMQSSCRCGVGMLQGS